MFLRYIRSLKLNMIILILQVLLFYGINYTFLVLILQVLMCMERLFLIFIIDLKI